MFVLIPLFFSIPNILMVREMQSKMPVEGGYYHWLKTAFGPFLGFMGCWMNWVVIDVFQNIVVLMTEIFAMWKLRFTMPEVERKAVPDVDPFIANNEAG